MRELIASEARFWVIAGTAALLMAVAGIVLFAPLFDVRTIRIRRHDPRIDLEEVQTTLAPLFGQRLVLVSRGKVRSMLQAAYPDIESVDVRKEYPSTLTVTLSTEPLAAEIVIQEPEHVAAAADASGSVAMRNGFPETEQALKMYITDKGYLVTSPVPLPTPPMGTLSLTDWSVRPQNRTLLLSPEFLQTITRTRDALRRDFGLESRRTVVYLNAQEYHIQTDKGVLWFDLQSSPSAHLQRFRNFLKAVPPGSAKEYVDLRMGTMIVYR